MKSNFAVLWFGSRGLLIAYQKLYFYVLKNTHNLLCRTIPHGDKQLNTSPHLHALWVLIAQTNNGFKFALLEYNNITNEDYNTFMKYNNK